MAVIWNEIRLRQDSVDCWSPFVDNIGGVWWTTWSDLDFDFPKCVKKKNWQTISSLVVGRLVPLRHRTTSVKSISSIVIIVYRWFSRTCYNVVMLSFTQRWSTLDSVNTKLCSRSFVIWNNSSQKKTFMYLLEWEKKHQHREMGRVVIMVRVVQCKRWKSSASNLSQFKNVWGQDATAQLVTKNRWQHPKKERCYSAKSTE